MALTKPFAERGEKKAISLTPDAEGTMNYQDGFGQRYSLPVKSTISEDGTITTTGGLWIQREQFNQLMFDATSAIIENQDNITQIKDDIQALENRIGDNQDLTTDEKTTLVGAINEINAEYVTKSSDQTITGLKTFGKLPQSTATPTDDKDLVTKLYTDSTIQEKISQIGKAFGFKGVVENQSELPTATAQGGDLYYNKALNTQETPNQKGFFVFNGDLKEWEYIGESVSMDFDKIFKLETEVEGIQQDLSDVNQTINDLPSKYVTRDTEQDITAKKTFKEEVIFSANATFQGALTAFENEVEFTEEVRFETLADFEKINVKQDSTFRGASFSGNVFVKQDPVSATSAVNLKALSEAITKNSNDIKQYVDTQDDSIKKIISASIDNINTKIEGDFVTLDTEQTITGRKIFKQGYGKQGGVKIDGQYFLFESVNTNRDIPSDINKYDGYIKCNSPYARLEMGGKGAFENSHTKLYLGNEEQPHSAFIPSGIDAPNGFAMKGDFYKLDKDTPITREDAFITKKYADDKVASATSSIGLQLVTITDKLGNLDNLNTTKKDNLVNAINEIDNSLKNNNFVTLNTEQTIASLKTFDTLPQSSVTPANDTDLVTKAYVDNIQVDTSNLAKLDKANTFTQANTFEGEVTLSTIANTPTITNPTEWASMGDNEIPTKKQIVDNIQGGGGGGNYLPLNINTDTEVTTTAGSNAQLSLNFTDYTVAQGATFEISNQENNIQFSKDTGINNIKLNQNLEFKLDSNINADVIFSDDYTKQKFQNALEIGTLSNLTTTNKSNIVYAINEVNTTTPKFLTQSIILTVGAGGNFADLLSAISEAAKYIAFYPELNVTIRLISDLNINSGISLSRLNLQYVNIDFNNFKIIYSGGGYCINLFYSTLGMLNNLNIEAVNGSGVQLLYSKIMYMANDTSIKVKSSGIYIANTSSLYYQGLDLNLHSEIGSNIICSGGSLCRFNIGGALTCTSGKVIFNLIGGGIVSFHGSENIGAIPLSNIAVNTLTSNGIIFKN